MASRLWACALVVLVSMLLPIDARGEPARFAGRRLEDALRDLQGRGLRVVFSTELVRPDMRVRTEPRSTSAAEQLVELLAPHGLVAQTGPGGVIQIIRSRRPSGSSRANETGRGNAASFDDQPTAAAAETMYLERLTVTGRARAAEGPAGWNGRELPRRDLSALAGGIADDPERAIQALPGVAASDDFRSEFSVRGSPYRHASIVVDDVSAPWLQHMAAGRHDTGTLAMLSAGAIDQVTLQVGAYPRIDGGQIGPQLRLTLREGSRDANRVQASVGATTTTALAEGPIGEARRGSWMAALRRSHVEWPVGLSDHTATVFGFTDVQSKIVYDVRPTQQVAASFVGGLSELERDNPDALAFGDGRNRAGLASVAWRSVLAPRAVVTQRLSVVGHDVINGNAAGHAIGWGHDAAVSYRFDLLQAVPGGLVEAGGQVRRLRGARRGQRWNGAWPWPDDATDRVAASWLERSAYASLTTTPRAGATLSTGARLADSGLADRRALDRWLAASWSLAPRWHLHAAAATVHQFPGIDQVDAPGRPTPPAPERATQAEIGVTRQSRAALEWNATVFVRRERDTLREPVLFAPATQASSEEAHPRPLVANALSGSAHGIELAVARRADTGLSGSIGYAYGVARYTDVGRGETFDADFDQRHALNVTGSMSLPSASRVNVTFRAGTNFPVPGYLVSRDGRLFAADRRNQVRLPSYARLDVRVERAFQRGPRHVVFFFEMLNVLNRANLGLADGRVVAGTGEAVGVTERLFPRTIGGGIRISLAPATGH